MPPPEQRVVGRSRILDVLGQILLAELHHEHGVRFITQPHFLLKLNHADYAFPPAQSVECRIFFVEFFDQAPCALQAGQTPQLDGDLGIVQVAIGRSVDIGVVRFPQFELSASGEDDLPRQLALIQHDLVRLDCHLVLFVIVVLLLPLSGESRLTAVVRGPVSLRGFDGCC